MFLAEGEGSGDFASNTGESSDIDCWEVEHFPTHAERLFNQGRNNEAIIHLVDFKRNLRYTNYDPVLLEAKMELFRNNLKFQ